MTDMTPGPEFLRFFPAILDELQARGGQAPARDMFDAVFERAGVTAEERSVTLQSGENRQKNQVRWARYYLLRAGLMGAAVRGEWRLTPAGMRANLRDNGAVYALYRKTLEQMRLSESVGQLTTDPQLEELELISANKVEGDDSDDDLEASARPYDATRTQIVTKPMTIESLKKRLAYQEIDLQPDFQRRAHLWTPEQKSRLIESILLRIPLPMFYFDASNDDVWIVVDGLQRLSTFQQFLVESDPTKRLVLQGLEYLTQFTGKSFDQLPRDMQRRIEETQVFAHLIMPGTPPEIRFHIFKRINTGGLPLSSMEIRHALYGSGKRASSQLLAELAATDEFGTATSHAVSTDRMLDLEFVLRYVAFSLTAYTEYQDKGMDDFLNRHMELVNTASEKTLRQLRERFLRAMSTAEAIFAPHTFRKNTHDRQPRSPVNKALFEAWSVTLGRCSAEECAKLIERREQVIARARAALRDNDDFDRAISQGTGDPRKVKQRFQVVEQIVRDVLSISG